MISSGVVRLVGGCGGHVREQFEVVRHVLIQRPLREREHVVHALLILVVSRGDSTETLGVICHVELQRHPEIHRHLPHHTEVCQRGFRTHFTGWRLRQVLRHDENSSRDFCFITIRDCNTER